MKVYIAGPYSSDPDNCTRRAVGAGQSVVDAGHVPFVPHLYHFWDALIPGDYEQWMTLDFAWLESCDALIRLDGESPGSDREVEHAKRHGIPVFYGVGEWRAAVAKEHSDD